VRRSRVFEGNAVESRTLAGMLQGLGAPEGALIVMDRGIATEENLLWLRTNGYRYLVVSRELGRQFDATQALSVETAGGQSVQAHKVLSEDGREVRLYCYSEERAQKEEGINERFAERFEKALTKLAEGLSKPRCVKALEVLWQRIGRLKEGSHGISQHYQIEVTPTEDGKNAAALTSERVPVPNSRLTDPGVYCLRSSKTDWDAQRLWETYIMLTDLEAVFRSLKSELGLRPVYHRTEERAEGHVFITVLAYQFVQMIRRHLKERGIHGRWRTLREQLSGQCRVTAVFRRADGRALHIRKATRAEPAQLALYQALGLNPSPGGITKLLI
jgi:transposase